MRFRRGVEHIECEECVEPPLLVRVGRWWLRHGPGSPSKAPTTSSLRGGTVPMFEAYLLLLELTKRQVPFRDLTTAWGWCALFPLLILRNPLLTATFRTSIHLRFLSFNEILI